MGMKEIKEGLDKLIGKDKMFTPQLKQEILYKIKNKEYKKSYRPYVISMLNYSLLIFVISIGIIVLVENQTWISTLEPLDSTSEYEDLQSALKEEKEQNALLQQQLDEFKKMNESNPDQTYERDFEEIKTGDVAEYKDFLTVEKLEEDIDGDGQNEQIILNVSPSPERHPENEGQYLWDDSHVWQLIVQNEGDQYTLFDDYVQGLAELYIVNEKENQNAIVFQQKGTTLNLSVFRFKGNSFRKEIMYESMILQRSLVK
jgi:hypothetical protein